jgi:GTP-binding protein
MFVDHIHLLVQAGSGGKGCDSRLCRPDRKIIYHGGDGGNGGNVVFRADTNAPPLIHLRFKQHIVAESGGHGGSHKKRGRNGRDTVIRVPVGTRVSDRSSGLVIREFVAVGEEAVVAKGGRGGVGNIGRKEAMPGEKGETLDIDLRVLLHADVFLVGLPNSGKTALLNVLTRCRAKEENYPFTTKDPNIGVLITGEDERLTVCDLPSVYDHSHEGRGAGAAFLKHLETAKFVLVVLEPASPFAKSLSDGYRTVRKQIKRSDEKYLSIPHAVAVMKTDLLNAREKAVLQRFKPGVPVLGVSVNDEESLRDLTRFLVKTVCKVTGNLGK